MDGKKRNLIETEEQDMTNTGTSMQLGNAELVNIKDILRDDMFRCRVQENKEMVNEYKGVFKDYQEDTANGKNPNYPFPPIVIWKDENKQYLVAGFHRYSAAEEAGITQILAQTFTGTKEQALMFAIRDNRNHGLRMTYGDLQHAIAKVLKLSTGKTAGAIAKELGYTRSYVYRIEKELSTSGQLTKSGELIRGDGKVQTNRKTKKSLKPSVEPSRGLKGKVTSHIQQFAALTNDFPEKTDSIYIYDTLIEWAKEQKRGLSKRKRIKPSKKASEKPSRKVSKKLSKKRVTK